MARNLAHASRDMSRAKRDIDRERSLDAELADSSAKIEAWIAADSPSPGERVAHNEQLLQLAEALEELPDAQRSAVEMHYWQGQSLAEIGLALERSPAAVAGLLRRGLQQLRSQLSRDHHDPADVR